ncbi:MAG: ATP-dependent 6-phosphofructokinase [Candidatus Coproplasma sp.]
MRIGILTSGGDCSGLNAVIRAVGLSAFANIKDLKLIGIPEGYGGLIRGESFALRAEDVKNILGLGGTVLGSSRQPFKQMEIREDDGTTRLEKMVKNYRKMNLDCLICLGGAGTHKNAALLKREGCNVIGVPKTIDNDIYGTDVTFGFQTAVEVATDCMDRIRTTAESHSRVMLVEIMGNKAGWLTLHSGIASGADAILIPEIPFSEDELCEFVAKKKKDGARSVLVAVAEGASIKAEAGLKKKHRSFVRTERGETTITPRLAEYIEEKTGYATRASVLGYVQRGGAPCAYDRLLCTRLGEGAADLAAEGRFGVTLAVKGNRIVVNDLDDIAGKYKYVTRGDRMVKCAEEIGIFIGK